MRAKEREGLALRTLAAMPFVDRLELAAVTGVYEEAAHVALRSLEQAGLANFIRHASPLTATTHRWFVTTDGLCSLASETETDLYRMLRTHPASAHWQRILLARLDAVAVVYRLASAVADVVGPPRFRWYRADPLDAAMLLPDGRTVGVIRQGPAADRTSLSDRVRRLLDPQQSRPRALLTLMPDEAKLRQARRLLARYPGPVYLTIERDAARLLADDKVWHGTSAPALLSLREIMDHLRPGGTLPWETPTSRLSLPDDTDLRKVDDGAADHLLPVVLKPTEKRMLDCLADWPLVTVEDLSGILGLSDSRTWRLAARLNRWGIGHPSPSCRSAPLRPQRWRAVPFGPQGPGLRWGCCTSLERRVDGRTTSVVLARPAGGTGTSPCSDHRPHPGSASVHGSAGLSGEGDEGPLGIGGFPTPSSHSVLPVRRKPAFYPSRWIRCGLRKRARRAFLPR